MVIADFGSWKLTLREVIFAFLIIGIMSVIGFLIAGKIEQEVHNTQLKYRRAIQIDKNPTQFAWALDTDVGDAFIEGSLTVVDPVSHKLLDGKWMKLKARYQKYQQHTRTVTYTTTVNGKPKTRTKIETYWSWDTYDTEDFSASQVEFLDKKLYLNDLKLYGVSWDEKIVKTHRHRRVVFSVLPTKYFGTLFTCIKDKKISNQSSFLVGMNIENAYKYYTSSNAVTIFWIFWIVFIGFVLYGFFVIDNTWLED